jgi:hypothetical protein
MHEYMCVVSGKRATDMQYKGKEGGSKNNTERENTQLVGERERERHACRVTGREKDSEGQGKVEAKKRFSMEGMGD